MDGARARLADIAQLTLPGFKCHPSVIVGCFDGEAVSHELSRSPNAEPADPASSRRSASWRATIAPSFTAIAGIVAGGLDGLEYAASTESPDLCRRKHARRAMRRARASSDASKTSSSTTGLGMAFENFSRMLNGYISCRNTQRRKKSPGWKSPEEHRLFLGYAA